MGRVVLVVSALLGAVGGAYLGWRYTAVQPTESQTTLEDAWARVKASPRDGHAWASLGDIQAEIDELAAAEHAYRTGLQLAPEDASIPGRLGFLLYGQGRFREARALLELASARGATMPMLSSVLGELREHDAAQAREEDARREAGGVEQPPEVAVVSDCFVPLARSGTAGTFRVDVRIGGEPAALIVDTGATISVLDENYADALPFELEAGAPLQAVTAAGSAQMETVRIPDLTLGSTQTKDMMVALCPGCGGKYADGLLGLDVLASLGWELDITQSRLRRLACDN